MKAMQITIEIEEMDGGSVVRCGDHKRLVAGDGESVAYKKKLSRAIRELSYAAAHDALFPQAGEPLLADVAPPTETVNS